MVDFDDLLRRGLMTTAEDRTNKILAIEEKRIAHNIAACKNCGEQRQHHEGDNEKCLFAPTVFEEEGVSAFLS